MAVKEKTEKRNRVLEFLKSEHKYENLILAVLSIFAIELGVLLLNGSLVIPSGSFLIGDYWKVFAWILVGLGVVSLILSVSSFYRPSLAEIKHLTALKKKEFLTQVLEVVVFSVVVALLVVLFDYLIELVITWIF
jgi:preprotein translocase subunit SecE